MIRSFSITVTAAICLAVIGCSSSSRRSSLFSPKSGELTELNVLTAPVGLDLDGRPGIDGFSVRVYGNIASNPKPVPIVSGTLEVLMFDGTVYGRTNVPTRNLISVGARYTSPEGKILTSSLSSVTVLSK